MAREFGRNMTAKRAILASRRHRPRVARLELIAPSDRRGWLRVGPWRFPCSIGPSGVVVLKREGDGGTPHGLWPARQLFFRPDRLRRPRTRLATWAMTPTDGWCDAAFDRNYNRTVPLPYPASAESLWRDDELYDLVLVLGFNDHPRVQGRGSAIFMHVARPDHAPTAGCLALSKDHLLRLVSVADRDLVVDTRR